jgi:hypothetical protein
MVATLCWYDSFFGPYHPQTLCLMAQVAFAYWQVGEPDHARPMLERAVKDLGRFLGREDGIRLRAIATLRDLLVAQDDYERAGALQNELLECQIQSLGSDHPDTLATRANFAMILLENVSCDSTREV